ncbi:class I SAM-dependent methyltransferase [Sphingomonas sp. RHCKR47]|uniref:class I SAM-dependent methyltransferase n=1 Tax=Sphingomonas citricola TaxID=2862498 RepID=UPI001C66D84B|nr:class I SAM-dependent methyltransferase [Sphingomonas citricola]MBW6523394.1 class I SAM-dependent methyltransferase [Sphingomonas citricola]
MRREQTITPDWFENLFREQGDPWSFETSAYEAAKYDHTLGSLSRERYDLALEVGCANGVLTQRLADRCAGLIAVDVSGTALAAARARCADHPQVRFERRQLPGDAPDALFDLVVLSEVIYYWDRHDLARAANYLRAHVRPGGEIMLVHWIGETDYPLSGDDAVEGLRSLLGDAVTVTLSERREQYRLDRWRRT